MGVPDPFQLTRLDVLPPQCSLQVEAAVPESGKLSEGMVRFRAEDNREDPPLVSEWSGWFNMADAPIPLNWDTFWL